MGSTIEQTLKALTEFENQLAIAKSAAEDDKKRMIKGASDLAFSARAAAITEAQKSASERVGAARMRAKTEADSIRMEGDKALKGFLQTLERNKDEAAVFVEQTLLGESA